MSKKSSEKKELKIRDVVFDDLYEFLKILEDVKFTYKPDPDKNTQQIAIEAIKHILINFHTARGKLNSFLGSFADISGEEFGKLPIRESAKVIKKLIAALKEADFFSISTLLDRLK